MNIDRRDAILDQARMRLEINLTSDLRGLRRGDSESDSTNSAQPALRSSISFLRSFSRLPATAGVAQLAVLPDGLIEPREDVEQDQDDDDRQEPAHPGGLWFTPEQAGASGLVPGEDATAI
jgi:hypothetical protein